MIYSYLRVSTDKQATDTQEHDLAKRFPDATVFRETASSVKARPVLEALLSALKPGDTLAVAALDRLGRKTSEIIKLIEDLQKRGVSVISLRDGVDYSTPTGRLVTQILVSVSELERSLISQRTCAAMQALKAKGVRLGRPAKFSAADLERARQLKAQGETHYAISQVTGISVRHLTSVLR